MIDYKSIMDKQRDFYASGQTRSVSFRKSSLNRLRRWIKDNDGEIMSALKSDLNKAPFEAYATEIGVVLDEIKHVLHKLSGWSRAKRVPSSIKNFPSGCRIIPEPYGITLIMSPWNYPFMLTVAPLVAAISAGNCALVKPSAYSPATSAVVKKMCEQVFDGGHVTVIEGGRLENQALLDERFDKILFTGSAAVGKTVMQAAAQNLTPIILELGGKSPCIVDETADIKLAAKRIAWGKFLNAGQTCVAPDYLLVHKSIKDKLAAELKKSITAFFGDEPCKNDDLPRIINEKHFGRLTALIHDKPVFGGRSDRQSLRIEPTLIDATWGSEIMQDEIFGPILPVLTYENIDEVIGQVNARPKPLALYLFTKNKQTEKHITGSISYGGGCINDTVVHLSIPHLPFGGIGESGMGSYHGKAGFDAFTHYKSVLKKSRLIDIPLRYHPYKEIYLKLLKKL